MRIWKRSQSAITGFPLPIDWEKVESQAELLPSVKSLQGLSNHEIKSYVNAHMGMANSIDKWKMIRAIKREQKKNS